MKPQRVQRPASNEGLHAARKARADEFYTQLTDIEKELRHYTQPGANRFMGKAVYCNCDDPYESNFFKYFVLNFNRLGLRKLVTTSYAASPVAGSLFDDFSGDPGVSARKPHAMVINEVPDMDGDGRVDMADVDALLREDSNVSMPLTGDGDFRSRECVEFLGQSDIVVTNPPFSLFREYVRQLMENGKDFLVLGNLNAISYKEIFPLFRDRKIRLGPSISSGDREFRVPDSYPLEAAGVRVDGDGRKYISVKGVRWFTTLEHDRMNRDIQLWARYDAKRYPVYDNYDAINVDKVADIPMDYDGAMGVPITFLDKHNPDQFEVEGLCRYLPKTRGKQRSRFNVMGKEIYARIVIRAKRPGEGK